MKKNISFTLIVFILLFLNSFSVAQPFKFIAMTDCRGDYTGVNEPALSRIIEHIGQNQKEIKFIIFPGDLVTGSKKDPELLPVQLSHWKNIMSPFYLDTNLIYPKIYVTVGNHEIQTRFDEDNFRNAFPEMPQNGPYDEKGLTYSFDYNKVHFTVVNTNRWYYGNPDDTTDDRRDWRYIKHLDWLENDLKSARKNNAEFIFVIGHEPAFPIGGHLMDCLPNLGKNVSTPLDSTRLFYLNRRDEFWNLLKKYNVSAYICGHEHLYGRQSVEGVYQITTGSAGAELYELNPKYSADTGRKSNCWQELSYEQTVPYYQILNYYYGKGENSQASRDFFGMTAFNYSVFDVSDTQVIVSVFGALPKEDNCEEIKGDFFKLDEFIIFR